MAFFYVSFQLEFILIDFVVFFVRFSRPLLNILKLDFHRIIQVSIGSINLCSHFDQTVNRWNVHNGISDRTPVHRFNWTLFPRSQFSTKNAWFFVEKKEINNALTTTHITSIIIWAKHETVCFFWKRNQSVLFHVTKDRFVQIIKILDIFGRLCHAPLWDASLIFHLFEFDNGKWVRSNNQQNTIIDSHRIVFVCGWLSPSYTEFC